MKYLNGMRVDKKCRSLPLWERGLKSRTVVKVGNTIDVAPLVGAWIEIQGLTPVLYSYLVAPLVGAWIEISRTGSYWDSEDKSLPLWERGLKSL